MSKKSVLCIASSILQAEIIVSRLKEEGFSYNDISALFPDKSTTRDFAHNKGATAGAGTGAVLGGALSWLTCVGALAIPGVGPLVAAGPIATTLSVAALGGTVGGITGGLIGLDIPEFEARRYEGKIREGGILISVHTEDSDEVRLARDIFERARARDVSTAGEAGVRTQEAASMSH